MQKWNNTLKYMFDPNNTPRENVELKKILKLGLGDNTIDRTGLTPSQKDLIICRHIPKVLDVLDLNSIIADRGNELFQNYQNLHLMWSGGIDSTTAFYALLNSNNPFTVIFNNKSILEYPWLGNEILNGSFANVKALYNNEHFHMPKYLSENPDVTIVTGEIGDQTFGSSSIFNFTPEERKMNIELAVANGVVLKTIYDYTKPKILVALKLNDMSTITLSTYIWALNFIFKYQSVQLRLGGIGLRTYNPMGNNNAVHFFDTDRFNSYALLNYQVNSNFEKETDYKMPLKEYIYSQNNDSMYLKNKTKEDSLTYRHFA